MLRKETDSLGEVFLDKDILYGIHTYRAKENFPITKRGLDPLFIKNLARVKKAAALINGKSNNLTKEKADAIIKACDEIIDGNHLNAFVVDLIQGGAGTSANMNANEVIANLAIINLGGKPGQYDIVHPIDDVNMHQSTNDVIPTAARITTIDKTNILLDTLQYLVNHLQQKAIQYKDLDRVGRTQLQDAVPMKVSQQFNAYASLIERNISKISDVLKNMYHVNLGATAIGTGINTTDAYLNNVVDELSEVTGYKLEQFKDLFDGTQNVDDFASLSSAIKVCALSLSKMAKDFILLSSGPNGGLREFDLPDKQSGSSIMPGKINPVIPEVLIQSVFLVAGNDLTISMACESGQLELNAFLPVLLFQLYEEIDVLNNTVRTFVDNCLKDLIVLEDRLKDNMEHCYTAATVLNPIIGYDKSTKLMKQAMETKQNILDLVEKEYGIDKKEIEKLINPVAYKNN